MSLFQPEMSRFTGTNDRDGTRARDRDPGHCPVPFPVPVSPSSVPVSVPVKGKRGHYEVGAEIFAALMWGPKTWQQVEEQAGLTGGTSVKWLRALQDSGIIRVCGYTPNAPRQKGARIWALQTAPFALPDEVKA